MNKFTPAFDEFAPAFDEFTPAFPTKPTRIRNETPENHF